MESGYAEIVYGTRNSVSSDNIYSPCQDPLMYGVHAHIYSPKIKVYPLTDGNKKMISF